MSIVRHLSRHLFGFYNKSVINNRKTVQLISDRNRFNTLWKMSLFQFSSVDELKVEHNPKKQVFFVQLGKDKGLLEYRNVSPGVVDLYHTEVPKQLRGKGIAQILAKEAFDFVVENELQMIVSCTYLQKYLKDNPKAKYLESVHK